MYLNFLSVALTGLAVLDGLVSAAPPRNCKASSWSAWSSASGTISTRCYTRMASSSVPWMSATTWSTQYTPCVSTTTAVSTVTVIPPSITTTATVTSTTTTTAPTSSFTSTVTTTATSTTSVTTTTVTTTTTTTTTTTNVVSTVATSTGFLPIQTTDPGTTYDGAGGSSPVVKRASSNKKNGLCANTYPQGVACHQFQPSSCSTSTLTRQTTVTGTSTGTVTVTSTSIVTSTVVPSATVTTTTTTTSTTTSSITSTATSTSTTTSTVTSTTATVYAACATNNFADYFNGNGIYGGDIVVGSYSSIDYTTTNSTYDCCVAALTDPNIGQIWFFSNGGTGCQIAVGNQCTAQSNNQWQIDAQAGTAQGTIGNANCGEFTS